MFFTGIKIIVKGNNPFILVETMSGVVSSGSNFFLLAKDSGQQQREVGEVGRVHPAKPKALELEVCRRSDVAACLERTHLYESGNLHMMLVIGRAII